MVRIESSRVVVSRDPTIDPSELLRRRIYLFRDTSIVGFLLLLSLPFASRSRAALAKYSRVRRMEGAGRFAPVFSLSLSFFTKAGAFIKHSPFIFLLKSLVAAGWLRLDSGRLCAGHQPVRPRTRGSNSRSKGSKP